MNGILESTINKMNRNMILVDFVILAIFINIYKFTFISNFIFYSLFFHRWFFKIAQNRCEICPQSESGYGHRNLSFEGEFVSVTSFDCIFITFATYDFDEIWTTSSKAYQLNTVKRTE